MTPANDNRRPTWFDTLLLAYQPFIFKRCRNLADSDDMVQAITLRAIEKWHQYRPVTAHKTFATWLSFMCRDVLREGKHAPALMLPANVPATQELSVDIQIALARLTKRESKAVKLRAVGYTKDETAKRLGVSSRKLYDILAVAQAKVANDNNKACNAAA